MLRPFEKSDCYLLKTWNAELESDNKFIYSNSDDHSLENAQIKFGKYLLFSGSTKQWFTYLDHVGNPSGIVCFIFLCSAMNSVFLEFYLGPKSSLSNNFRLVFETCELAFNELKIRKLGVEFTSSNKQLSKTFKAIGFKEEGRLRKIFQNGADYVDVVLIGMLDIDWMEQREIVKKRILELDNSLKRRNIDSIQNYKIVILSDEESWINSAIEDLIIDWTDQGHKVNWYHEAENLLEGDFCFCLSFGKLINKSIRNKFSHCLVVHESDLPKGKGWSPLTWQVLEGSNRIPVTLFEAEDNIDSGVIYAQSWIEFSGWELLSELHNQQAIATQKICRWFIDEYPNSTNQKRYQNGIETFYKKRNALDSKLDPNKSLAEQFNLLRVVDNNKYPAFIEMHGKKFTLKIFSD